MKFWEFLPRKKLEAVLQNKTGIIKHGSTDEQTFTTVAMITNCSSLQMRIHSLPDYYKM